MTREKALKLLNIQLYGSPEQLDKYGAYEHSRALKMAINALEQEPCEDSISRAEAILQIQRHGVGCFDPDEFSPEQAERFVINMLNELPSVNPQPKTGHWINGKPICPCCGENKFKDLDADIWSDWQPKFCPNCGAKMFEPQESEET